MASEKAIKIAKTDFGKMKGPRGELAGRNAICLPYTLLWQMCCYLDPKTAKIRPLDKGGNFEFTGRLVGTQAFLAGRTTDFWPGRSQIEITKIGDLRSKTLLFDGGGIERLVLRGEVLGGRADAVRMALIQAGAIKGKDDEESRIEAMRKVEALGIGLNQENVTKYEELFADGRTLPTITLSPRGMVASDAEWALGGTGSRSMTRAKCWRSPYKSNPFLCLEEIRRYYMGEEPAIGSTEDPESFVSAIRREEWFWGLFGSGSDGYEAYLNAFCLIPYAVSDVPEEVRTVPTFEWTSDGKILAAFLDASTKASQARSAFLAERIDASPLLG